MGVLQVWTESKKQKRGAKTNWSPFQVPWQPRPSWWLKYTNSDFKTPSILEPDLQTFFCEQAWKWLYDITPARDGRTLQSRIFISVHLPSLPCILFLILPSTFVRLWEIQGWIGGAFSLKRSTQNMYHHREWKNWSHQWFGNPHLLWLCILSITFSTYKQLYY